MSPRRRGCRSGNGRTSWRRKECGPYGPPRRGRLSVGARQNCPSTVATDQGQSDWLGGRGVLSVSTVPKDGPLFALWEMKSKKKNGRGAGPEGYPEAG